MKTAIVPRSRKLGFSMVPMIDVVFLLIIFFLVSSHLAQNETRLPLELPVADSGEREPNIQTPRVTINLRENGELLLSGRPVNDDSLAQRLAEARDQHGKDIEVRIRCSRETPYQKTEPIMLACMRAKIWNVTYAVLRKEGE